MAVAAGGSDATNVVWLAEQCQLLERRNLSLRREVRSLTEALAAAAADADTLRLRLTATEEAVQSVTLKAGGAARREEKLLVTVESLRARIREVEAAAAVTLKERRTEGRILDRVCAKHAATEELAAKEHERHAAEEAKYDEMLENYRTVTEREKAALQQELELRRRQAESMTATIQGLESQVTGVKAELLSAREQLAGSKEREDALTLEREMLMKQLEELTAAYHRDMSEARAQSAGTALLQSRLLDTEGLLREAEAEVAELKASVGNVLSQESSLVGKIMVARSEVVHAKAAKARADRLTQQQHMATIDLQLKLDRGTDESVAVATRDAVAVAVRELTSREGPLRTSRALNSAVTRVASDMKKTVEEGDHRARATRAAAGTPSAVIGRLAATSKLRPASPAQQARAKSAMAAARSKAEQDAAPWLEALAEDDADDAAILPSGPAGTDNSALAKVMARERKAGKQMLARHLLQRAFDHMDRVGAKTTMVGRRMATASGGMTDRATADSGGYDESTVLGITSTVTSEVAGSRAAAGAGEAMGSTMGEADSRAAVLGRAVSPTGQVRLVARAVVAPVATSA